MTIPEGYRRRPVRRSTLRPAVYEKISKQSAYGKTDGTSAETGHVMYHVALSQGFKGQERNAEETAAKAHTWYLAARRRHEGTLRAYERSLDRHEKPRRRTVWQRIRRVFS